MCIYQRSDNIHCALLSSTPDASFSPETGLALCLIATLTASDVSYDGMVWSVSKFTTARQYACGDEVCA